MITINYFKNNQLVYVSCADRMDDAQKDGKTWESLHKDHSYKIFTSSTMGNVTTKPTSLSQPKTHDYFFVLSKNYVYHTDEEKLLLTLYNLKNRDFIPEFWLCELYDKNNRYVVPDRMLLHLPPQYRSNLKFYIVRNTNNGYTTYDLIDENDSEKRCYRIVQNTTNAHCSSSLKLSAKHSEDFYNVMSQLNLSKVPVFVQYL